MKINTKRCGRCKTTLALACFPRDRSRPDGYGCYCKACRNARNAQYRAEQTPDDPDAARYPQLEPFRRIDDVLPLPAGMMPHEVRP